MSFNPQHSHHFSSHQKDGETRTRYVLLLTVVAMVAEIVAGTVYGSMALLADGWHMGTHAAAFCITLFAYQYERKYQDSARFSFGTGKVSVLGGFTSAITLGIVSIMMLIESIHRLLNPETISFNEAILVAILGLVVNIVSMMLLHDHHHHNDNDHNHNHEHEHEHEHEHNHEHHHDHNLRAAYLHVLADALTSVLAIVALLFGKFYGWNWLDAIMGIVGAFVIGKWTLGLIKQTSPILLDENIDKHYRDKIETELSQFATVLDLHVWKISGHHYSAAIILESKGNKTLADYQHQLAKFDMIKHLTIEIHTPAPCIN